MAKGNTRRLSPKQLQDDLDFFDASSHNVNVIGDIDDVI